MVEDKCECTRSYYGIGLNGILNNGRYAEWNGGPGVELTLAEYEKGEGPVYDFNGFTHVSYNYALAQNNMGHVNRIEGRRILPIPFGYPLALAAGTGFEFGKDYWSVNIFGAGLALSFFEPKYNSFYLNVDGIGQIGLAGVSDKDGPQFKWGLSSMLHAGVVF